MQRYIAGRVFQSLITLLVVSVIVFALGRMMGNPLDVLLPIDASPELRQQETERLGLNEPFFVQYGLFIRDLATGDLGTSIRSKQPVLDLLVSRLPDTLQLVGLAMAIALLVGFPLGVLAADAQGRRLGPRRPRRGPLWPIHPILLGWHHAHPHILRDPGALARGTEPGISVHHPPRRDDSLLWLHHGRTGAPAPRFYDRNVG